MVYKYGVCAVLAGLQAWRRLHSLWLGNIVDSGIELLYRPANLCILVGRYDNPMPQSTISPSQGLGIWLLLSIMHKRWLQATQYELQVFLRFCFGGGSISYFSSAQEGLKVFLQFCFKWGCRSSWLGTGKFLNFLYSVHTRLILLPFVLLTK